MHMPSIDMDTLQHHPDDVSARLRQLGLADEPDPHLRLLNSALFSASGPALCPAQAGDIQTSAPRNSVAHAADATGPAGRPLGPISPAADAGILTPAAFGGSKPHTNRARSGTAVSNMSAVSDMTAVSNTTTVAARTAAGDGLASLPLPLRRSSQNVSGAHASPLGHTPRTSLSRPSTSESPDGIGFALGGRDSPLSHTEAPAEVFAPGVFGRGPRTSSRAHHSVQGETAGRVGSRSAAPAPSLAPRGRPSTASEGLVEEPGSLGVDAASPSSHEASSLAASGLSAAALSSSSVSAASIDRMARHERSFDTLGTGVGSLSSPSFTGNTFATSEASFGSSGHLTPRDFSRREARGGPASSHGSAEARSPPKAPGLKARSARTNAASDLLANGKKDASSPGPHEAMAVPPVVDFSQLSAPRALGDVLTPEEGTPSGPLRSPMPRALSLEEEASTSLTTSNPLAVQRAKQAARALPSAHAMSEASRAVVYKENGTAIKFIELFANRKTIVVFPSHWACPHFQQYVKKLCNVNMAALGKAGYSLILVGQGSTQHMAAFQNSFPVPFSLYADPDRAVYRALGMQLGNPALGAYDEYLHALAPRRQAKKTGSKTGLRKGLLHLPLAASGAGGSGRHVLGGVFVLGPGGKCSFAHRLTAMNEYHDVEALLSGLGIGNPMLPLRQQIDPADRAKADLEVTDYWSAETPYYTNPKPSASSGTGGIRAQSFAPTTAKPERQGGGSLLQESKQRLSLFLGRAKTNGSITHAPLPSLGLPNRRPAAPFESMQNFSEPMYNPDPFATQADKGEDGLTALPTEPQDTARTAPWRVNTDLEQRHRLRHSASVPEHNNAGTEQRTLNHAGSVIGPGTRTGTTHSNRAGTGVSQFLAAREASASAKSAPADSTSHPARPGRPGKISVRQLTTAAMQPMESEH